MTGRAVLLARKKHAPIKARFHYASWFGAGSELVRSWFEPDSIMKFGFCSPTGSPKVLFCRRQSRLDDADEYVEMAAETLYTYAREQIGDAYCCVKASR